MIYARTGSKGTVVRKWQRAMNAVRRKTGTAVLVVDGDFGPKTLKATIAVQRYIGTKPDGLVGPMTVSAFKRKFPEVPLDIGVDSGGTTPRPTPTPDRGGVIFDEEPRKAGLGKMLPWVIGAVGVAFFLRKKKR